MKLIQPLISDSMSVNSLKPSINSEPECSLDSCIMKESPVDNCILSEEIDSQKKSEKELNLTDYDMGNVGNATKKMFEHLDLNSSLPGAEVQLRKDTWNSGTLYDNTSEKENINEPNEVRFDILSDDDTESMHLKISSDDENSVIDSEECEQTSSHNELHNRKDDNDISRDVLDGGGTEESTRENLCLSTENVSECSREEMNGSLTSETDTRVSLQCNDEREDKHTLESDHEDPTEENESMPSVTTELSELSVVTNDSNTSDKMVNEVKSTPTSPKTLNSDGSEISESKFEISNKDNLAEIDKNVLPISTEKVSKCDGSLLQNLVVNEAEFEVLTEDEESSKETEVSRENISETNANIDSTSAEGVEHESTSESTEKTELISCDNAVVPNICEDTVEINEHKLEEDGSNNESMEEETVCSEELEVDHESKNHCSPESTVADDSIKEGEILNDSDKQSDLQLLESSMKDNSSTEEKFLEILEYQPMNEEGEELREFQSDKDELCDEIQPETLLDDKSNKEKLVTKLCSNEELLEKGDPENSNYNSIETDNEVLAVKSPKGDSSDNTGSVKHNVDNKEKVCDNSNSDSDVKGDSGTEVQLNFSDCKEPSEINTVSDNEEDNEVQVVSKVDCSRKTEPLPESFEVQSGRKRTSSSEENLVICSKRTKVSITESEIEECEVLTCDKSTDNHKNKRTEVDTKEKCDTRSKRHSNSVSDIVEIKKVRVMQGATKDEQVEKASRLDNTDEKLASVKNSENVVDSKKELDDSEDLRKSPLRFFRKHTRAQIKKLTRSDLEELVLQKICEAITERSQCGELRERAQSLEQKLKQWQKKSLQLTKQVKDLNLVLKRYGNDLQNKGPNACPVRITRSVGLQVQLAGGQNSHQEGSLLEVRRKSESSQSSVSTTTTTTTTVTAADTTSAVTTAATTTADTTTAAATTTTTSSTSTTLSTKVSASSPVTKPTLSKAQKVSEGGDTQGSPASVRQTSQPQPAGGKVLLTRSPSSSNVGPANANKLKQSPSHHNKTKSSSDLQVIDLTDAEEKTKSNTNRPVAVSNNPPATSAPAPTTTTVVTTAVSNAVSNMGVSRSIRLVQHLSGPNAPILAPSAANAVAGQRVTYLVPTTSVPVQQRQLIISSASPIRPAGVVSMSQRQNPLPTIVLKPGQVVPVSPMPASGASIIRTSGISTSILTSPRMQPRPGQILQRVPVNANPVQSTALTVVQSSGMSVSSVSHPAPLPPIPPTGPSNANWKLPPPKPDLKISKVPNRNQQGIVLSWNMTVSHEYEEIASYQLFAYQEGTAPPHTQLWKKVGDVKALPLPMACTLTQFMEGHKYHFAVRAVDVYARYGPFSSPGNILLTRN